MLQPTGGPQRGRRRPRRIRHVSGRVPCLLRPGPVGAAADASGQRHPRHQTRRGHPAENRPAFRDAGALGRSGPAMVAYERVVSPQRVSGCEQRVLPLPDAGGCLAYRQRPPGALHAEGGKGSQGAHVMDGPEPGFRGGAAEVCRRGAGPRGVHGGPVDLPGAHGRAGKDHLSGPGPHQVHRPGYSGYLPGERSPGPQPGGPGQPPAGGFRSPRASAGPARFPVRRRHSEPGRRRHG